MSHTDVRDGGKGEAVPKPVVSQAWYRPPTIVPNVGKPKKLGPKSNLSQVLLYDNVSQEQMLQTQLTNLNLEEKRSTRLLDLHKKSFLVQQSIKQHHLRAIGVTHISFVPDEVADANCALLGFKPSNEQPTKNTKNNNISVTDPGDEKPIASKSDKQSNRAIPKSDVLVEDLSLEANSSPNTRSHSAFAAPANTKAFMTHNYHTRREKTSISSGLGRGRNQLKALKDPRYISLKRTLVPAHIPVDGYLQLSPSGQYVIRKYGTPAVDQENVQRLIRGMTMYCPSRQSPVVSTVPRAATTTSQTRKERRVVIQTDSDHGEKTDSDHEHPD